MYYRTQIKDYIRVPPDKFDLPRDESVLQMIKKTYEGHISKQLGVVIEVSKLIEIGEGVIIPGDGATYYDTAFELLTFKPELQEVLPGRITDIADFGAFMSLGPIEGMVHISQTMDDYVSFSKERVLTGKDSKRSLKVGDLCKARIIAISYKDPNNPKIGLTMRQPGLGRLDWLEEDTTKKAGGKKK
ncbi:DNA-directed RNA polymerase [Candidatus Woesearchaeota archaeon]|nr:DNA-directed RNA polymerase [Candidatus Woesearchaeota archaeon]